MLNLSVFALSAATLVVACSPQDQREASSETRQTLDTVQAKGDEAAAKAKTAAVEVANDPDVRAAAGTAKDAAALAAVKLGEAAKDAASEIRDPGDASDQDKPAAR
jgi:hypothetical protein